MPLTVNTNVASLAAQRAMLSTNSALETSFERLSTGKRINSAVDDAAGLSIANQLESKVNGLNQAIRNINDGISVVSIAEGALSEVTTVLQRLRDLAVQGASDTLGTNERTAIETETDNLIASITSAIDAAEFGSVGTLDGTFAAAGTKKLQVGADSGDTLSIAIEAMTLATLDVEDADIEVDTNTNAATALTNIDAAIAEVNTERGKLGALQSQLESSVRNLANVAENSAAARSRIIDTDYAVETANLTKNQILQQASTSILAQANQQPQSVLALLQ